MEILTVIAAIGAAGAVVIAIIKSLLKVYELVQHQNEQDADIKAIKEELALIVDGVHACLDGLEQQGCNHSVPVAKEKLYNHINEKAHK